MMTVHPIAFNKARCFGLDAVTQTPNEFFEEKFGEKGPAMRLIWALATGRKDLPADAEELRRRPKQQLQLLGCGMVVNILTRVTSKYPGPFQKMFEDQLLMQATSKKFRRFVSLLCLGMSMSTSQRKQCELVLDRYLQEVDLQPLDLLIYVCDNMGTREIRKRCKVVQYVLAQIQVVTFEQLRAINVYHPDPAKWLSRVPAHDWGVKVAEANMPEMKLQLAWEVVSVLPSVTEHLSRSVLEYIRLIIEWTAPTGVDVERMAAQKHYSWPHDMAHFNRISGLEDQLGFTACLQGLGICATEWTETEDGGEAEDSDGEDEVGKMKGSNAVDGGAGDGKPGDGKHEDSNAEGKECDEWDRDDIGEETLAVTQLLIGAAARTMMGPQLKCQRTLMFLTATKIFGCFHF